MNKSFALPKAERISSRKAIDRLFRGGGSRSMSAFPLRMVYMVDDLDDERQPLAQMMVSVPKRCFKRAVKRNRAKRQVREAYRHNKHTLIDTMARQQQGRCVRMAFIWLDAHEHPTATVGDRVQSLIIRLSERLGTAAQEKP